MNDLDFTFEETPWDVMIRDLESGEMLSAVRFLTVMEDESEENIEDAFLELERMRIGLDITDLPKSVTGEAALRLRREAELVKKNLLPAALEENDPLRLYLEELAGIPACGDPDVLAMECAEGKKSARERLLNVSLHRVVEIAKCHVGNGVLLLDLIQEGSLGLWQAIMEHSGGDFLQESEWWIRQSMAKLIVMQARANGVGQKMRSAMEDYRAVDERLLAELGRNATIEEIAEELHMSEEETLAVKKMLDNARLLNQAKKTAEPEEETEEEAAHVEDTALFQMRQRIMDLLSGLNAEDSKLLTLRFGLEGGMPLSPEETGRRLGLTPEEVVAREAAALARLRNS